MQDSCEGYSFVSAREAELMFYRDKISSFEINAGALKTEQNNTARKEQSK